MKLPVNSSLVNQETMDLILKRTYPDGVLPEEIKEKVIETTFENIKSGKVTCPEIENHVSDSIEGHRYNINDILSELITQPSTLRFRVKMKDALERVLSILLRYQHMLGIKKGISRGEIGRNLAVKYRKNLDFILVQLEQHHVISAMNERGKNFYKINIASADAAIALQESLKQRKDSV